MHFISNRTLRHGVRLRGAPTLEPRQTALPVRIPLPRVAVADSIFDDQAAIRGRSFGAKAPASMAKEETV